MSAKELATATFDYSQVDKDTKSKLICFAGQFAKQVQYHAQSGMEAGKIIAEAHKLFAGEGRDGQFAPWVEAELKVSRQTAYNYMWAWQRFGNCKTIYSLDASAMYKLASPAVPEGAAKEAIKLTEKGQRVDSAKAKEILDKFREIEKPKPPKQPAKETAASPAPSSAEPNECAPGKHKWGDDGCCSKCYVSREVAEPDKIAPTDFPTEKLDAALAADEAAKPKTPDEIMAAVQAEYDEILNYLKQGRRVFNAVAGAERSGPWLIDKRTRIVASFEEIRDALVALRPGGLCTKCKGKGCDYCHKTGHLTGAYVRSRK